MDNIIDWEEFIDRILDGGFSFDIRKMGSASMFIKNQLSSLDNQNMERGRFKKSLIKAIEGRSFDADESLNDPQLFNVLMDLGIEFLGSDALHVKKCCALYIQLRDIRQDLSLKNNEDIGRLLLKSSFAIIKFIENWKNQNEILGITDIYGQHLFIKYVMQKWRDQLLAQEVLTNPNVVVGLIYLDEWVGLSEKDKRDFFSRNAGNSVIFSAIISDMERLEGNLLYGYTGFADDCKRYDEALFEDISDRCHAWVSSDVAHRSASVRPGKVSQQHEEWLKEHIDLDGLSLKSIIESELNKDN